MSQFAGKTAVISGGAEGIGLGIARALGQQGMNVVLGDIDPVQLDSAQYMLEGEGIKVLTVQMDVADLGQWQKVADAAVQRFGTIHMLVNNAGVSAAPGPIERGTDKDWRWVLDVNLMGIIYGAQTMLPLMKSHGEGGWLINVASMAGMVGVPMAGAYTATKFAVVGLSEAWQVELKPHNIHVSVLCPAFVKTRINLSGRNKPQTAESNTAAEPPSASGLAMAKHMQAVIDKGLAPNVVGQRVVEAINNKELYIFTHPNYRQIVQQRFKAIDDALSRAESSPLLAAVLDEEPVGFS